MKNKSLLVLALISALTAIVVVVVLKILGMDNQTVFGGGVAGGIIGALSTTLFYKKRK